jgi:hypothetical protein
MILRFPSPSYLPCSLKEENMEFLAEKYGSEELIVFALALDGRSVNKRFSFKVC